MKHLISMRDLSEVDIMHFINTAEKIEEGELKPNLSGKMMAALFYEPSTRTHLSFEAAMKRIGGSVISMSGTRGTSVEKGESLADTVRVINQYVDIIVIRHSLEGAPRYVSEQVSIPVVNAGDGANQHPTQSLLDLYSIKKTQNTLHNLTIALVGDLKYGRTVHSLVHALMHASPKFYFISPSSLQMPLHIKEELQDMGIQFEEGENVEDVIDKLDILYMTRIQRERFVDSVEYEQVKNAYTLSKSMFRGVKPNVKVLHPLPRVNEINVDVDRTKYAYYFQQAKNGIYMRQAILSILVGGES